MYDDKRLFEDESFESNVRILELTHARWSVAVTSARPSLLWVSTWPWATRPSRQTRSQHASTKIWKCAPGFAFDAVVFVSVLVTR